MAEIISFRVVKEPYGWAVRVGQMMMTPFASRTLAIRHANSFVESLRGCGEAAEIILEGTPPADPPRRTQGLPSSRRSSEWDARA